MALDALRLLEDDFTVRRAALLAFGGVQVRQQFLQGPLALGRLHGQGRIGLIRILLAEPRLPGGQRGLRSSRRVRSLAGRSTSSTGPRPAGPPSRAIAARTRITCRSGSGFSGACGTLARALSTSSAAVGSSTGSERISSGQFSPPGILRQAHRQLRPASRVLLELDSASTRTPAAAAAGENGDDRRAQLAGGVRIDSLPIGRPAIGVATASPRPDRPAVAPAPVRPPSGSAPRRPALVCCSSAESVAAKSRVAASRYRETSRAPLRRAGLFAELQVGHFLRRGPAGLRGIAGAWPGAASPPAAALPCSSSRNRGSDARLIEVHQQTHQLAVHPRSRARDTPRPSCGPSIGTSSPVNSPRSNASCMTRNKPRKSSSVR